MYFIVFLFLCFLLFYDFCCLRSSFGSISSWINDIQSKKRTKLLIYMAKWKNHFAICFVHKMKKFSLFGLTFGRKRSRDSVSGGLIFRKLCVKIFARLQRKKSRSGAAESAAVLRVRQNLSRGASEVPPPPSAVRVKCEISTCLLVNQNKSPLLDFVWWN